jgi:hypothetical protein
MEEDVKTRTPTDTLMECLESFGDDEPANVIVVYTTKSGDIAWSTSDSTFSQKLGLLEAAKFWVQETMRKAREESDQ